MSVSVREPRHEREVVNASFLVADERLEAFDSAVERLRSENSGEMQFKSDRPDAAHSFADEPMEAGRGREVLVGLITGLLTLPLAPVRGVAWVAEKVAEEAEKELYDEGRILRSWVSLRVRTTMD